MNKYDYFRLIYALLLGYAISYKCKMDENDGKVVNFRPPSIVFSIIWPILYILLGFSWIYAKNKKYNDILYFILSSLLAIWLMIYSCIDDKKNAIYILLLTILTIIILIIKSPDKSRILLSPLLVWIFYALLLNTTEVQYLK